MISAGNVVTCSRRSRTYLPGLALAFIVATSLAPVADAAVGYSYNDECSVTSDCGPVGVLGVTVTSITGSLVLDIPASPDGGHSWDSTDVLSYSFTLGDFTIDHTNSSLSTAGSTPFDTQSVFNGRPFSGGDGSLIATYTPDSDVLLIMSLGGINLVQNNEPGCSLNQCQTLGTVLNTDWSRAPSAPALPAAFLLLAAVAMLVSVARRTAASR